jgi:DNA polymerase III subunit alpha
MAKRYSLLHSHTNYSALDSPAKPEDFINRCVELDLNAVAVTDHGNVSAAIQVEKFGKKKGIRTIKGIEAYICSESCKIKTKENSKLSHLVMLSKNKKGWQTLLKIVSESNNKEHFYHKARIDLETLSQILDGNIISFNGHMGSSLSNILFTDFKSAYKSKTLEEASSFLNPNWKKDAARLAEYHNDIFGKGNFYLEIQNLNQHVSIVQKIIAGCLREISKETKIPCVGTSDPHYILPEHKRDQQILLCSSMKTTIKRVSEQIANNEEVGLAGFFNKDAIYHIPSIDELRYNTEEEIENTNLIADMCEDYELISPPILPKFNCPDGLSEIEYLKVLAREGWKNLSIRGKEYEERIKYELGIIERAKLSGYFLIVQDFVRYMKNRNRLVGSGRGSAGGCLTSLLLGIIQGIDPVEYKLSVERFYNEGRNTAERSALPDIDIDLPRRYRQEAFDYFKATYGKEHFGHICTFSCLKGRSAMKDVLRVTDACDVFTSNEITTIIPDEAAISDELQDMREAGEEPSIIMWALQNRAKELSKYCELKDNGKLDGEYAKQFEQAIRLEGCIRGMSRHASAIVLSANPLSEMVPMAYDKTSPDPIIAFNMYDCEAAGLVKFDCLGLGTLDKIMDCVESINGR